MKRVAETSLRKEPIQWRINSVGAGKIVILLLFPPAIYPVEVLDLRRHQWQGSTHEKERLFEIAARSRVLCLVSIISNSVAL